MYKAFPWFFWISNNFPKRGVRVCRAPNWRDLKLTMARWPPSPAQQCRWLLPSQWVRSKKADSYFQSLAWIYKISDCGAAADPWHHTTCPSTMLRPPGSLGWARWWSVWVWLNRIRVIIRAAAAWRCPPCPPCPGCWWRLVTSRAVIVTEEHQVEPCITSQHSPLNTHNTSTENIPW